MYSRAKRSRRNEFTHRSTLRRILLAEDPKHKRKLAVNVLRPELAALLEAERLVQEINTTANL